MYFCHSGVTHLRIKWPGGEIILSLCFDKWKKCTTFAQVKVGEHWQHSLQNAKKSFAFHSLAQPLHRN